MTNTTILVFPNDLVLLMRGRPCEMCERNMAAHYWARFDKDGLVIDCSNSPILLWTHGNTLNKQHYGDRCKLPRTIGKPPGGKWTCHSILVQGRRFDFFHNEKTGEVKAPGAVEFKSDNVEDARAILYEAYYDDSLNRF